MRALYWRGCLQWNRCVAVRSFGGARLRALTNYSSFGIGVDRKHALKWLFPQEKATFHRAQRVYVYSETALEVKAVVHLGCNHSRIVEVKAANGDGIILQHAMVDYVENARGNAPTLSEISST